MIKMRISDVMLLLFVVTIINTTYADVKPARVFGSNMVLQQGIENRIWGWADQNEKVCVAINGKEVKTRADKNGKWIVKFPSMEYGGPYIMKITGKNKVQFSNILIGEVWVCSGQSNMKFPVSGVLNANEEFENAVYPKIRLFTIARNVAQKPVSDLEKGEWVECSPGSVAEFSAVGYFFCRKLYKDLNVAVGLIHTSWGGTAAETWTSSETIKVPKLWEAQGYRGFNDISGNGGLYSAAKVVYLTSGDTQLSLAGDWKIKFTEITSEHNYLNPNDYPTLLYNALINPIVPYGIKGVIWYQGEQNAERAKHYQRLFPNLITDWRNKWQLGNFPFLWVQLSNFKEPVEIPSESTWAELREAQTMTLKLPNTGMASAIDIGDAIDIHPRNKQDVGRRLALGALKIAYGKDILSDGPTFNTLTVKGNKVTVKFDNTGAGLKVKNMYGYVNGFSLAGVDGKFYWAAGTVLNKNTIVLLSKHVPVPVAVRFGWADNPDDLNLYNSEGLPANPFRTDKLPGITE